MTRVPHRGVDVNGKVRALDGSTATRFVSLTPGGHIRLKDILAVSSVSKGAERLIAENPN